MHYLCVDIEGMTGFEWGNAPGKNKSILKDHILAAANGMHKAGKNRIRVRSFHGLPEELPGFVDPVRTVTQKDFDLPRMVPECTTLSLLGFHGLPPECSFGHAYRWHYLMLNNRKVGEITIQAYLAAALGVPMVFFAGDSFAIEEIRAIYPAIRTFCLRKGMDNEGDADAGLLSKLEENACEAIAKSRNMPVCALPKSFKLEAPMLLQYAAELAQQLPYPVKRYGDVISRESTDFLEIYSFLTDLFGVCDKAKKR